MKKTDVIDVRIINVKAVYKGEYKTSEVKTEKLQKSFVENGFIKMRPFERILFEAEVETNILKGKKMRLDAVKDYVLKKGLIILSGQTLHSNDTGEIEIALYNSSQHLVQVNYGDVVAHLKYK